MVGEAVWGCDWQCAQARTSARFRLRLPDRKRYLWDEQRSPTTIYCGCREKRACFHELLLKAGFGPDSVNLSRPNPAKSRQAMANCGHSHPSAGRPWFALSGATGSRYTPAAKNDE